MAAKSMTIQPESEIGRLLTHADRTPLRLEREGVRYLVERKDESDIFANYDPVGILTALEQSRGALVGVDIGALKADLRAQRDQDSLGRPA